MSPVSVLPILPIVLLALVTVRIVGTAIRIPLPEGHYASIDGLRGYLAFFVFLHHSAIWYYFLRYRQWNFPPSRIYSHFGPTSVAFFFMITGFLFFSKLLNARSGRIDWVKLYTARVLRIFPLYLAAVCALSIIVAVLSRFSLREAPLDVISELFQWLAFTEPDINGIGGTRLIVAAVIWSLAFEWLFYFSLAFVGLILKIESSAATLVFTGIFLLFFVMVIHQCYPYLILERLSPFIGGIVAALLARNQNVRQFAKSKTASIIILVLLLVAVIEFNSVYAFLPFTCASLTFIGIACGNSLFGILTHNTSRLLGQISYSIYLLHGIFLFVTFRLLLGFPLANSLSPILHWGVIAICGILVVIICSFTYYYIELPFINVAPSVALRLSLYSKNKLSKTSKAS